MTDERTFTLQQFKLGRNQNGDPVDVVVCYPRRSEALQSRGAREFADFKLYVRTGAGPQELRLTDAQVADLAEACLYYLASPVEEDAGEGA